MADSMTFVNGSSAAFGVVDSRTGAFMTLHGTCIEACVAGPSAHIEVKHELYNDGVNDVCQGVLLVPIPLEWQVAYITVEYEGEVIDTVHAMNREKATVSEHVGVNPDLFFHKYSTTPVCSFHLPWAISIGSSLLITTQYMTSIAQSQYLSRLQGHGSELNEMCQLLLPSSILCLSHSAPNNKNSVKEDYNALFYNTSGSNPFAFRLKHTCSLHVIAQTFSPLCQGSVQLTKVGVLDKYNDVYACVNDAHSDNGNDVYVNNEINDKVKQSMWCVKCEVKEIGDCMFDLLYVAPLEELTCMTNANRHLLLTCLLRPSLEPIRVFLDYGKKRVEHSLANAILAQHNTTAKTSKTITKNREATTITKTANQDNTSLFDQLKNAVLIQVTPHLDSCPVNVEHIFVIDLSNSKQSKIHAQCIAESLGLALHALPPSVYVNVMCANSGMLKSKVSATPTFVFSDGGVPIDSVNISMLTNVIAKMCDSAQDHFTTQVNINSSNNHGKEEKEEEVVILESLLSLFSMRNAQVKCNSNYVRCVTFITNRTFYSLEMNETRFAHVIDHIAHQREHTIIINTLAITPNCNGETLAGLELMAHVGKGAFREVHIHEFYDTHTQRNYCNINDSCSNSSQFSEELSCDDLTVALNDILAFCTKPHLTNVRCDITSDNVDCHFTNDNFITASNNNSKCINGKVDKTFIGNAMKGNDNETNALFVCPDICKLTFAHCQPTYTCFFLPEIASHNTTSNNEMSVTISGNVGQERVEYTYSCPLHNNNNNNITNLCQEHPQKEITCLDTRIVHQCERLIYRQVAKTHVKELSEYIQTGMHVNQHEYIHSILAFLSHEYNITNSQTSMELSRKKKKMNKREVYANDVYGSTHDNIYGGDDDDYDKDDVSDEAIRFDDTFSKRLACKDQSVFMPFLHQKEVLHYLLNEWAVKHRARLAHASSEHVSCVPTGALTVAIALQYSTSTNKFIRNFLEDIVDSVLSYIPANKCVADVHEGETNANNTKRLLLLQRHNGSFVPSVRFALCVGLPLHMAASSSSSAAIMQFCNINSHSHNIEEYWATALALAYMREHSCQLTILSELLCVYYFTHSAHVQRNVWESWVESARQMLCCNEE